MGQGFQFTPGGLRHIGDVSNMDTQAMHGAVANVDAGTGEDVETESGEPQPRQLMLPRIATPPVSVRALAPAAPPAPVAVVSAAVNPKSVLKAARQRVKEIRTELKQKRALEKELAELERLLAAAKRPLASVTPISSHRAG